MSPSVKSVTFNCVFRACFIVLTVIVLLLAYFDTSLLFVSLSPHLLRSHTLFHLLLLKIRLFNLYFCLAHVLLFCANGFLLSLRHTVTISPSTKPVTLIVSSAAFCFATVIVSAAGAFVTGFCCVFYCCSATFIFLVLSQLRTLFHLLILISLSLQLLLLFPPSATASDVAFASPSFATLYTFTMSPSVKSVTLIVSFAPVLLFSTVIVLLLALLILPYHTSLLFVSFLSHLHLLRYIHRSTCCF